MIAVFGAGARLNRLPAASAGDMFVASVKKGKPELRKKGMYSKNLREGSVANACSYASCGRASAQAMAPW